MAATSENPTDPRASDEVRQAVLECYCRLNQADPKVVETCFGGGIEFDSILGVELTPHIEAALNIKIPESSLMHSKVFKSLATFALMVQQCVDSQSKETKS